MKRHSGIGLMSGTSLDGIDLAYVEFVEQEGQWSFELLAAETIAYDEQWYARLKCLDEQDALAYARTHVYYGHLLGKVLREFIQRNELRPDFVASHGHTIFHQPERNFTAQIGDGETIASYLPCPLVCNFRNKDVALGGQGAPLVPFGERQLWPDQALFLNLGGIANLSYQGKAFDVCACNMALNWLSNNLLPPGPFDPDGEWARSGNMDYELYEALEALPYFAKSGPKSLGAEWFQAEVLPLIAKEDSPVPDRLRSFVLHIVSRLTHAFRDLGASNQSLVVTGGGAHNRFLMEELQKSIGPLGLKVQEMPQQVVDFKEAIIFAFLGLQTLLGEPNILASVTGAKQDICGGSIHLPPNGGHMLRPKI
jgi:anhydro-N-acetylmuramic acid kinase